MAGSRDLEPPPPRPPSDTELDRRLGQLLQLGVTIAATVVLAGGVMYLVRHGDEQPAYARFGGEPVDLRSVSGVIRAAMGLRAAGIIQLGLLLLIATPVARVVFSVVAFVKHRDWTYVWISGAVLALLALTLSGAVA